MLEGREAVDGHDVVEDLQPDGTHVCLGEVRLQAEGLGEHFADEPNLGDLSLVATNQRGDSKSLRWVLRTDGRVFLQVNPCDSAVSDFARITKRAEGFAQYEDKVVIADEVADNLAT